MLLVVGSISLQAGLLSGAEHAGKEHHAHRTIKCLQQSDALAAERALINGSARSHNLSGGEKRISG